MDREAGILGRRAQRLRQGPRWEKEEQDITCGGGDVRGSLEGEPYHWPMDQMDRAQGQGNTSWRGTQGGLAGRLSWVMVGSGYYGKGWISGLTNELK